MPEAAAREGLFREAAADELARVADAQPELAPAVRILGSLLEEPGVAEAGPIAEAATEIAAWAEEQSYLETALEFAEAAAHANRRSPASAFLAGRLARRVGELSRSAVWYRRAIGLARGDHDAYLRAQLGLGGVMMETGAVQRARTAFRRASRLAIKYGRRGFAAQANHELLRIATVLGLFDEGTLAAERALERYPAAHPRLHALSYDYARLLLGANYFASALEVLRRLRDVVRSPLERAAVCGTLARTAGAELERALFDECLKEVRDAGASDPRILLDCAEGARSLGLWEMAERLGSEAGDLARSAGQEELAREAGVLLDEVAGLSRGESVLARAAPLSVQLTVGAFLRRFVQAPRGA
ncbi:MAG TPA: hypothetical protein VFS20_10910 [Longimicrobium sp.]|nr:hypothetical protein [Longimicrobium sp.]